jgi:hypothetical protein
MLNFLVAIIVSVFSDDDALSAVLQKWLIYFLKDLIQEGVYP